MQTNSRSRIKELVAKPDELTNERSHVAPWLPGPSGDQVMPFDELGNVGGSAQPAPCHPRGELVQKGTRGR